MIAYYTFLYKWFIKPITELQGSFFNIYDFNIQNYEVSCV